MNATVLPTPAANHRRTLLLIVALSLMPVLIGLALYGLGWRSDRTSNHGTLIAPPVALAGAEFKGKWSLVLIGDAAQEERLDELRRVRVVLAKEWARTRHVRHAQLDAPPAALGAVAAGTVLIVDPNGLAMMRYAPGADAKGIRADLERLLKYSWIG